MGNVGTVLGRRDLSTVIKKKNSYSYNSFEIESRIVKKACFAPNAITRVKSWKFALSYKLWTPCLHNTKKKKLISALKLKLFPVSPGENRKARAPLIRYLGTISVKLVPSPVPMLPWYDVN